MSKLQRLRIEIKNEEDGLLGFGNVRGRFTIYCVDVSRDSSNVTLSSCYNVPKITLEEKINLYTERAKPVNA